MKAFIIFLLLLHFSFSFALAFDLEALFDSFEKFGAKKFSFVRGKPLMHPNP
jgi:hypothetical protein